MKITLLVFLLFNITIVFGQTYSTHYPISQEKIVQGWKNKTSDTLNPTMLKGYFNGDNKEDVCALIENKYQTEIILLIVLDIQNNETVNFEYSSEKWLVNGQLNVILEKVNN